MDFGMEPHGDGVLAQRLDRRVELDAPAVHLVALGGDRIGNILGGHRAEELALFAGLAGDGERERAECLREGFRSRLLGGEAGSAHPGLGRDALLVALGCLIGKALRKEIVPRIARPDAHQFASLAERADIVPQNHIHHRSNPPVGGDSRRRRKAAHESARPSSTRPPTAKGQRKSATTPSTATMRPGDRAEAATKTARPRATYSATITTSRLPAQSPSGAPKMLMPRIGRSDTASAPTRSQMAWSLKRNSRNRLPTGPTGRAASRWYHRQA